MRIAYITAGAAGMYCGSCMHDNTLARTLIDMGHDMALMPAYTPLRTDEESVTVDRVFYGAINIYLKSKVPFLRHTPRFLSWLLDRPRLLTWVSRFSSSTDASELGDVTLATLQGETGPQDKELDQLVDWLEEDFRPDLVHLSHTLFLGFARRIRERLGVPVVCSLQGEDLFIDGLTDDYREKSLAVMRERAQEIAAFTSPTRYYAQRMGEMLHLPEEKVALVPLGIRTEDFAPAEVGAKREGLTLGYLARICPDKGLHHLVEAFLRLAPEHPTLRLRVAGYLGEGDRPYFEEQQAKVNAAGLGERVDWIGEVDRADKVRFLHSLDLFSVPTVYREPKGLSILEALASGVPVVQPAHGSFPEILQATGGGLTHEPGSVDSLAANLSRLLHAPDERVALGNQARDGVERYHSAQVMADDTLALYQRVLAAS